MPSEVDRIEVPWVLLALRAYPPPEFVAVTALPEITANSSTGEAVSTMAVRVIRAPVTKREPDIHRIAVILPWSPNAAGQTHGRKRTAGVAGLRCPARV
ncbi:hypothetical protein Airi01_090130 [Actinoallomurus iriomotensis]|uniref:Uncharacterized protein n=1 Tax=Actinoallomurus iriomotensis TaxID=478107 RepID=A0A9W6RRT2_9ACTN|nr:hypothetical protein Airi01_090130 [Actinoallomurus iriomotensis]